MSKKEKKGISKKTFVIIVIAALVFLTTILIIDEKNNRIIYKNADGKIVKFTLAPQITKAKIITIDDASRLNKTVVAELHQPQNVEEIKKIIQSAREHNQQISISGIRHTMGGQAFLKNAIHLDMTKFDKIRYNSKDKSVTAQSGATWQQIQQELNKHGRAVAVMQDSNIFTVGGSVSVNAHGKDRRLTSMISSVNSLKILDSEGREITASRNENPELFKSVFGGYGLFGVITEVNIATVDNSIYDFHLEQIPLEKFSHSFFEYVHDSDIILIEAHFSVDKEHLLTEALVYYHSLREQAATSVIPDESYIALRKFIFENSKKSDFGKVARWELEKLLAPHLEEKIITRNAAMSAPVLFLESDVSGSTDILQEYFIPVEFFEDFIKEYREVLTKNNINITNLTIRNVWPDEESAIPYAPTEMYALAAYYTINRDQEGTDELKKFTGTMIDLLKKFEGKYYLSYGSSYTKDQLFSLYPALRQLPLTKEKYDPHRLFSNNWYKKYFD